MKILAIRTHWHPVNTPGSRRFESFLTHLVKTHDVTLLSLEHPKQAGDIRPDENIKYKNIHIKVPSFFYITLYQRIAVKLRGILPQLDRFFSFGGRLLNKGIETCTRSKYDMIITTYQPVSSLWVASRLSKKIGLPWICDLRDLPNQFLPKGQFNKESLYLKKIISNSCGVTCATEGLENRLKDEYARDDAKTIYNGIPGDWLKAIQKESGISHNKTFDIVYAGSLYAGRSLDILLKAIELLPLTISEKKLINVRVFGSVKSSTINNYLENYKHKVSFEGIIEQKNLKDWYQKSSILVNLMPEGHSAAIPSKIFEYAASGVQILNISPEESFVSKFISNSQLGITTNSVSECSEWLLSLFKNWEISGNMTINYNAPEDLMFFTREKQAAAFQNYIEDKLKR